MLNPGLDRQPPSWRAIALVVAALALVALPAAALWARQAAPATLAGTIYDVSGAVLPGVEVVLVDANQVSQVAYSNGSGRFEFSSVAPGKYDLRARLMGFRPLGNALELGAPDDWKRILTLQVADVRETVMVREPRVAATAPSSEAPLRLRVGGNIRPPRKQFDVRPDYPPSMRAAGLTGVVPLDAVIGQDGTVTSVRVLSAEVHPDFAIAAVDAVRQWRYTPTLLNGVAVEVVMTVTVQFDLD